MKESKSGITEIYFDRTFPPLNLTQDMMKEYNSIYEYLISIQNLKKNQHLETTRLLVKSPAPYTSGEGVPEQDTLPVPGEPAVSG